MKTNLKHTIAVAAALLGVLTLGATAAWSSGPAKVEFPFSGRLLADPPSNANSISVSVETGNKRALRAMLGAEPEPDLLASARRPSSCAGRRACRTSSPSTT